MGCVRPGDDVEESAGGIAGELVAAVRQLFPRDALADEEDETEQGSEGPEAIEGDAAAGEGGGEVRGVVAPEWAVGGGAAAGGAKCWGARCGGGLGAVMRGGSGRKRPGGSAKPELWVFHGTNALIGFGGRGLI